MSLAKSRSTFPVDWPGSAAGRDSVVTSQQDATAKKRQNQAARRNWRSPGIARKISICLELACSSIRIARNSAPANASMQGSLFGEAPPHLLLSEEAEVRDPARCGHERERTGSLGPVLFCIQAGVC